jgi:hypothetical protein
MNTYDTVLEVLILKRIAAGVQACTEHERFSRYPG